MCWDAPGRGTVQLGTEAAHGLFGLGYRNQQATVRRTRTLLSIHSLIIPAAAPPATANNSSEIVNWRAWPLALHRLE